MFISGRCVAGVSAGLIAAAGATADPINFLFSKSVVSGHSASAAITFDSDGGNTMVITLTNAMELAHASTGSRALTGMFFDIVGDPAIGSSATVAGTMVGAQAGESTNPTDYWAFRENLDTDGSMPAGFGGARYGLGAAGFSVFGFGDILGTPTALNQPNGIDGGILSSSGLVYTGQNQTPLVRTAAVFTFILDAGFFDGGYTPFIENVSFQFGSGFDEPSLHLIPLPTSAGLAMVGFGVLATRRRR